MKLVMPYYSLTSSFHLLYFIFCICFCCFFIFLRLLLI